MRCGTTNSALFFAREKQDLSSKYVFNHFLTKVARVDFCDRYRVKDAYTVYIFSKS